MLLTHIAAYKGFRQILHYFLNYFSVDQTDSYGDTALQHVIFGDIETYKKYEMLHYLIHFKHANVNLNNELNVSPLLNSIEMGEESITFHLLHFTNADVNHCDTNGNNALMQAIHSTNLKSEQQKLHLIIILIKSKHVNARQKNLNGTNALHMSAHLGYFHATKYLLEHTDIDIQDQDNNGNNVLFYTLSSRNMNSENKLKFIKYFIRQNVNVNAINKDRKIILDYILPHLKFLNITKYLLENTNVNINFRDIEGNAPFHNLILSRKSNFTEIEKLKMLKLLVNYYGANLNSVNNNGESILHHAASYLEILKYLIEEKHMNVYQQDFEGNSIVIHVMQSSIINQDKMLEIIQYLLKIRDININVSNFKKITPLLLSFQKDLFQISTYLMLNSNADVYFIDPNDDANVIDYVLSSNKLTPTLRLTFLYYLLSERNVTVSSASMRRNITQLIEDF